MTPRYDKLSITVAIIGAGPLGRWLALAGARAGFRVLLEDVMPSALEHAQKFLAGQASDNVEFVSTIEDAVRDADLVIDCVPDELESKLEIFCLLDRMAPPRTVIATPTTALSIADLASCTYRADRCVAIAADPRQLAGDAGREVLLRTTSKTGAETAQLVRGFFERIGFQVAMERDPAEASLKS